MPRTVHEGFTTYLQWKTPSATQRQAASLHRSSVRRSIENAREVYRFIETGSFGHGTGVAGYSDVDVLVSLKGDRPTSSDTALNWIRAALTTSFPRTYIRTSRPAVVVAFASGYETFEVIPGFIQSTTPVHRYSIPAPGGGWMDTTPEAHLDYVDAANTNPGGAKDLARLVKAWKYHQQVPISSFYLEMRAAQHMATQTNFIPVWDLCLLLEKLDEWSLRPMQDPTGNTGSIRATSSTGAAIEAQSKLATAATRARKALNAYNAGNPDEAFHYLDLLFGGTFPSR